MNGQLWQITADQLPDLIPLDPVTLRFARLSYPLLAGIFGSEVACVVGLIPPTLLADVAHLWLWDDPAVAARHRVSFARHAQRLIAQLLRFYPTLQGYCVEPSARRWLTTLGAEFADPHTFTIRKTT